VIRIVPSEIEPNPASVSGPMAAMAKGVFKARDRLLLALDLDRVFALPSAA
jgi:chemotaxis signal transduction protein